MSRRSKVKMYRVSAHRTTPRTRAEAGSGVGTGTGSAGQWAPTVAAPCYVRKSALLVGVIVKPGEPAGELVDDRLRVGMLVHVIPQSLGQPANSDLVLAATLR